MKGKLSLSFSSIYYKAGIILVIICTAFSTKSNAANGDVKHTSIDGVEWTYKVLNEKNRTCQVGGGSDYANPCAYYFSESLTSITVPSKLDKYEVTAIGDEAFSNSMSLMEIRIPDNIENIGNKAFYGCKSLKEFVFPSSVKSIGNEAFSGCLGLNNVIFKGVPQEIMNDAFKNVGTAKTPCNLDYPGNWSLTIWNNSHEPWYGGYFNMDDSEEQKLEWRYHVISETDKTCEIYSGKAKEPALSPYPIGHVEIPAEINGYKVIAIGNYAFWNCIRITSVSIPSEVHSIGEYSFSGCTKLEAIDLRGIETIGVGAFNDCDSIKSLKFSSRLQQMGESRCPQLERVDVTDTATLYRVCVNADYLKPNSKQYMKADRSIAYYVNGELLESLIVSEGMTSLPAGCLQHVELKILSLPSTLTTIEKDALSYATSEKIYCYATTPPTIVSGNTMQRMSNTLLYVPYGTRTAYKAKQYWNKTSTIVEMVNPNPEEGQYDVVTVNEGGELRLALSDLENTKVKNLKIIGKLDASDIALIRKQEGRLSTLERLDLSQVTLVPGDQPYYTTSGDDGSGTFHSAVYLFYISDERSEQTKVDFHATYHYYFDYCLPMAFSGLPLKHVILPDYFTEVGSGMFSGCNNLEEVVLPSGLTAIGSSAFSGCTSLRTCPDLSHISKIGVYAFENCSSMQGLTEDGLLDISTLDSIPEGVFNGCKSVRQLTLSPNLKYIGNYAFSESGIREIELPNSLNSIGDYAFNETAISKVSLPNSLNSIGAYAFSKTHLTNIILPNGITEVGMAAFSNCTSLQSAVWPESAQRINGYTFGDCTSLTSITLPEGLCRIVYGAFYKTPWYEQQPVVDGIKYAGNVAMEGTGDNLVFREGTTGIADYFNDNDGMEYELRQTDKRPKSPSKITLPSSLKYIGYSAFFGALIESVTLPEGLEEISDFGFYTCDNLSAVSLPASLKTIGALAFDGSALEKITIPEAVEFIGVSAFGSNKSLLRVNYEAKNAYCSKNYYGVAGSTFARCNSLERVTIGANVERIPDEMFKDCEGLLKVEMGANVREIGDMAFHDCKLLSSIEFPEGLISIGNNSFSGCTSITSIRLPQTIKILNAAAFSDTKITEVELPASLESLDGAFSHCNLVKVTSHICSPYEITSITFSDNTYGNATLYVPTGTRSLYQATPAWSRFQNILELGGDENAINHVNNDTYQQPVGAWMIGGQKGAGRGVNIIRDAKGTIKKVIKK